ncbi:MAG: MmcQ/YjbR family DNA-binding protein [Bacteroidota bacterium]
MNIEQLRTYCISKKGVTESFPFNETVLVFKVMDKMFLLTDLDDATTINVKCEPEYAMELREKYDEVTAGFHMNKKYWNTIVINESLNDKFIQSLIDHSYEQVVDGLPKRLVKELNEL